MKMYGEIYKQGMVQSAPCLVQLYYIKPGKNVTICGKHAHRSIANKSAAANGIMALAVFMIGTLAVPLATNRRLPTGGVMPPVVVIMTMTTPNWIGSMP